MDDRKIEIFLAAERCGSLSAAARQCFCTQSAATQAMDALEAELGVHLLDRGPSGVSLTEAGTRLSPRAHEVADALARLKAAAAAERGEAEVRVGAYSSIAAAWLPAAIARMSQAEPGLRAYVRTGTQAVREWLLSGEVDVALGDDSLLDPSRPDVREAMRGTAVRWVPIAEDPFLAVLPEDEAWGRTSVTHAELAEIGIVAAPRNALGERLEVPCESAVTVSTDDDAAIAAMVAAGVGATAMPALSLRAGAPAGTRILELVPPVSRVLGAALTAKSGPGAELLVRSLS